MRPRVSETRQVAALLDREWPDVEALAEAVTVKVMELVAERTEWCVVMLDPKLGTHVFGTYDTEGRAKKALGSTVFSAGPEPARAMIRKIIKE